MVCAQCAAMSTAPLTARRTPFSTASPQHAAPQRLMAHSRQPRRMQACQPVAALNIDWSDPDTLIGLAGAVLGIAVGIGAPAFYISRDNADEKRLEELRELNRETFKATGEYMTEEEIAKFRRPRWTDRREFQDDD